MIIVSSTGAPMVQYWRLSTSRLDGSFAGWRENSGLPLNANESHGSLEQGLLILRVVKSPYRVFMRPLRHRPCVAPFSLANKPLEIFNCVHRCLRLEVIVKRLMG